MALSSNNSEIIKRLLIGDWIKLADIIKNDSLESRKTIKILVEDTSLFLCLNPFEATQALDAALAREPNIASIFLQNPSIRAALVLRHQSVGDLYYSPSFDKAIDGGHIDLVQDLFSLYGKYSCNRSFSDSLGKVIFSNEKLSSQTLSSLLQIAADLLGNSVVGNDWHIRHKRLFDEISSCIITNKLTFNLLTVLQQSENFDQYLTPDALTLLNEKRKRSTQTMQDDTSPEVPAVVMHYNTICEATRSQTKQETSANHSDNTPGN